MSVKQHFIEAQSVLTSFLSDESNFEKIETAGEIMVNSLKNGGKILSCGNGGSMCDAMHFAEELTGKYRNDRPAIGAISMSDASHIACVGNDYGYDYIFSRYLQAVGRPGDVLLAISTSGNSKNVLKAMEVAKELNIKVIGLTGKDGGKMAGNCEVEIRAPHTPYADRAQEIHIKCIHALIDYIEQHLF